MLNAVLLVVCICILLSAIFYLFFWNRFFAFVFSLILRLALWNQGESSLWLEFGAIHFSTLAGRILIKDLRYHSSNQTFRIVKVQLSWRYWLRRPAEEEDLSHARVIGEDTTGKSSSPLACRVHISMQGLEWFMYNRTASFDNVISQLDVEMPSTPAATPVPDGAASVRKVFSRTSVLHDSSILGPPVSLVSSIYKHTPTFVKRSASWVQSQLPNLDPKDLLPISIEATKGAITIGNASTPNLLVAEFRRAEGTYGVVEARSKHDLYKQVLNIKLLDPSLSYVENERYTSPMVEVGRTIHERVVRSGGTPLRRRSYLSFYSFQRIWQELKVWAWVSAISPSSKPSHHGVSMPHPPTWNWWKHQKSVDEETPSGADLATLEYAIDRKILEAPVLELLYYADVVGIVPAPAAGQEGEDESLDPFDIGNGDLPPEWGIDLVVRGGFIRYGPWADRQRIQLQHAFFPPTYANATPTPRLKPGDMRMWTGMKVFIELRDGVSLLIPFREASKNWQWDKADVKNKLRKREAASIHLRAGDSSTISYIVPMIASSKGYLSMLEVHLDTVTVTSSLNDIRLLTAESCRIRSHLPTPLKWNGLRQWTFAISLRQPCFYLLRDHINMITDLGKDWSSGPPTDPSLFTPMIYVIDLDMHNYAINLYVNDHNIIDKPLIKEDNAILTLRGTHFTHGLHMPFTKYRPNASTVSFWIEAPDIFVDLSLPRWNIFSLFPTPDRNQVGHLGMLNMSGSYRYFADVKPENADQLKLEFAGRDGVYKAFGWTIRYLMILRENYFGSFTHFSTLTEYLDKRKAGQPLGDPIHLQYREGQSNAMQVTVSLAVDNALIAVPAGFPGYEKYTIEHAHNSPEDLGPCLMLSLPALQLHLRTNDYYMEMSLNVDPITGRLNEHCYNASLFSTSTHFGTKKEKIVIDGLDILANRLFGHRPAASTYVCIWEIHIGDVKAVLNSYEARLLSTVGSSFGLNFSDPLNSPAKEYAIPADPDVTFLKVRVDAVNIVWSVDNAAMELTLPNGVRFDSNDLAGKTFRKVTGIRLPQATAKLLLASKQDCARWIEVADAHVDVDIDIYSSPPGWQESAQLQAEFVAAQDGITGRAKILYSLDDPANNVRRMRPGRGILDSDFYLPQIRIPRLYSVETVEDHMTIPIHQVREDLSESDTEPLPEAVRDARVADLRPANITIEVLSDGEQDLTSGDESDDTDSTDYSTDYDDTFDEASVGPSWLQVNRYSGHCKHYEGRFISRPSFWHVSPFTRTRDVTRAGRNVTHEPLTGDAVLASAFAAAWADVDEDDAEDCDRTIFRARSKHGVCVWTTPLILPVFNQLLEDCNVNLLSPELRFDVLTMQFIKAFKSRPGPPGAVTTFDIHIPIAEVYSLQLVDALAPLGTTARGVKKPAQHGESCATVVELITEGLHLRARTASGANQPSRNDISGAFSSIRAALLSKAPSRGSYRQDQGKLCYIAVGPSFASIMRRNISVSLGVISADIGHAAPAYLFATSVVLAKASLGIVGARKHSATFVVITEPQLIHAVLKSSHDRAVVDPLSTIQPSFLIQHGLPDRLRKDATFKFLVYLRSCLRFLDEGERQTIYTSQPDISVDNVLDTLQAQWYNLAGDDDSSSLSQQTLLQELLGGRREADATRRTPFWEFPYDTMSFSLDGMRLALRHFAEGTESNFVAGPITVTIHQHLGDLVQPITWTPGKSHPNLLSKDRERRALLRVSLSISLDCISSTVHPQLVEFTQIALRDYRQHSAALQSALKHDRSLDTGRNPPSTAHSPYTPARSTPSVTVDCTLAMRSFTFTAAAEQLIVRFRDGDITYASSLLANPPSQEHLVWEVSTNHSLMFNQAVLEACSAATPASQQASVLASLTFADGRTNVMLQRDIHRNLTLRALAGLGQLHLDVPRSALRLYRFVEGWRADYLPGIEATVRGLLNELGSSSKAPSRSSSQVSQSPKLLNFQIQTSIASCRATLRVMHGTWLSWEVRDTIAFLLHDSRRKGAHLFGLQMGPHVFDISRSRSEMQPTRNSGIRLSFPTITLRGKYDSSGLEGLALVEFFHVTVRPSDWDTLLSVQQKSGQDFNDLIHIIEQTRQKRPPPTSPASLPTDKANKKPFKFSGSFKMKGFRIGLEGLTSTLFLECDDISGGIGNMSRSLWHIRLSDLALSLAAQDSSIGVPAHRERRSAFVRVDIEAGMGRQADTGVQHLQISVNKIHAVMQPSSIGELADYVDHLQADVLIRQEQRATELEEFKEKTRSLMKSLDVKIGEPKASSEESFLELYNISLTVRNVGVAFPLTLARDLQMPRSGSLDDSTVRAFLFSVKTIEFGTQLGRSGQASMTGFSFQFVSRFRQGNSADFCGENHKTKNKLIYPEMTAKLRSERVADSRLSSIEAEVSGFILDVDSSIPDFVSSLLEVYRRGKDRVERLAYSAPRSSPSSEPTPPLEPAHAEERYGALLTSNVLASLTFASGKVRMHSREPIAHQPRSRPLSTSLYGRMEDSGGPEEFNLPEVSMWVEFRATPAVHKLGSKGQPAEPSTLIFKSTIHSSQNTLRPTLLPFFTELMAKVEEHMRSTSPRNPPASPGPKLQGLLPIANPTSDELPARAPEPVSSMKISFSLRIDQSKLLLTCRPDANVIAGLHWDSGGFVVNIAPGARRVSFTGTVGGLTVSLKHGFLSEDCVKLDARNLNFSIAFAKVQPGDGHVMSSVSVVLDTEFSGGLRFSRFQDVLCFRAVWLDRIPTFSSGPALTPLERSNAWNALSTPSTSTSSIKEELTTAVLIRFRRVELDVDLGQSISAVKLTLDDTLVRTKITERLSELSLAIGNFSVVATGNLAGHAEMPDFQFQTIRQNDHEYAREAGGRMLDLSMTSGVFTVKLDSEYHELIQYRAEPISVYIYDDWSRMSSDVPAEERRVTLDFLVTGTDVLTIMTVGTVPKLVTYVNKFRMNLETQREGAARESRAFRLVNAPKPDNPLSAVANAMFQSAKSRLKENEAGLSYTIGQRMSLKLKLLRLIVLPRSMRDPELAQFVGQDVHARLHRLIQSGEEPARRDLQLFFSGITISKISQLHHGLLPKEQPLDSRDWLATVIAKSPEATIFGLPAMDMQMRSEETQGSHGGETRRVLKYDFSSSFSKAGAKDAEDIYISLNMSLYSWLTILRKTFAREMEQVQLSSETRSGAAGTPAQAVISLRKKHDSMASPLSSTDRDDDASQMSVPGIRTRSRTRGSISSRLPPLSTKSVDGTSAAALSGRSPISPPPSSKIMSPTAATFGAAADPVASSSAGPSGAVSSSAQKGMKTTGLVYVPQTRRIERLTMRQLGEATPDVMHPFFMKKAGFNLEDSLPQYVHEYATMPTEEIMKALLKLYSKQLTRSATDSP
ncbi:hypothetical protein BD309DRAFT_511415 [Dichomitus squalens]|uniref:Csf1 N-terminal domain-containing protein n=1 Tax=Dichomitus squalens TaxID=114155 RepID=A0A4Q9P3H9_9APHY|nr:hypothetical protein BD309DRAFT_511415 [Dichomitus squalens]TBU64470.1 hypothetical protein BD310DRAFT_1034986 [Dichomitus squalens]